MSMVSPKPLVIASMSVLLLAGVVIQPAAEARRNGPSTQAQDGSIAEPVDPGNGRVPGESPGRRPPEETVVPGLPGSGPPDEVGVTIEPRRLVQLIEECDSIAVAGRSVAAHNCADGIDILGTLPPDAPFTTWVASKERMVVAFPFVRSGSPDEIELPFAAEPVRRWVKDETGERLRRQRP
jgi:hypothetical protein